MKKTATFAFISLLAVAAACDDDDDMTAPEPPEPTTFDVVIANVSATYELIGSGAFTTPVGADAPGPLTPGNAYEATFYSPPDGRLSVATMFVQSNDLFYAPDGEGIPLYEGDQALSGDITDRFLLWDGGTEVNQEPGLGADQAPRQAGPDTGDDDPDDTVRLYDDPFDNIPAASDVMQITLTAEGGGRFVVRIENIGTGSDIPTSDGGSVPFVLSPGVWTVGSGTDPLFTAGEPDRGEGLEAIAEDGDPSALAEALADRTGVTSPLAPGVYAVHSADVQMFTDGQPDAGLGMEALAEDGDPAPLAASVAGLAGVSASGVFNTPAGASGPGPALPGDEYGFTFEAVEGDRLSFATMFVQSNDLFFAPDAEGLELFSATGTPLSGDITNSVMLWDAGTEVNEMPGIGPNQAPRQTGPDTGPDEAGTVRLVDDGYTYPDPVVRVTITPRP